MNSDELYNEIRVKIESFAMDFVVSLHGYRCSTVALESLRTEVDEFITEMTKLENAYETALQDEKEAAKDSF